MYNTGEQPLVFESLNSVNYLGVAGVALQVAIAVFAVCYIAYKLKKG